MSSFFDKILSKYQCSFCKGPLALLEKWKTPIHNGESFGALLIDLSKAFDCLDNKLFIVKRNAYGSNLSALKLVYDYTSIEKKNKNQLFNQQIVFAETAFFCLYFKM